MSLLPPTDIFPPTRSAALARIDAIRPGDYARTRNAIEGAVSWLSPYITHGIVSLPEVLAGVSARHPIDPQHKFVFELGWREYFRHVWQHRGQGILQSLHEGPLPDSAYAPDLPDDIRQARTGVPAIDTAVRTLYDTGSLHNHARMWLASYVVHIRKVHWRAGADWLYGHLLDGDLASNHLSWQWVAGTGSRKPYLFNADNVARYAPAQWHSPGSVIDTSYEALERLASQPGPVQRNRPGAPGVEPASSEPPLSGAPPTDLGWTPPDPAHVAGRDVWLVHPWNLGDPPAMVPADAVVLGVVVTDFHRAWPWNERRWRFVTGRTAELTSQRWCADAATLGEALRVARRVRTRDEPHLAHWLVRWAECSEVPRIFPALDRRCDSFSQWWTRAARGASSIDELLHPHRITSGDAG